MKLHELSTDESRVRLYRERMVATARVALSAGGLVAIYLDPAEPARYAALAYGALVGYLIVSIVIAVVLRVTASVARPAQTALYLLDITFAGALTAFTLGAGSPFIVFFWFVVLTAGYRSGRRGAFRAAALLGAILVLEALVMLAVNGSESLTVNQLIVRGTHLAVMAFLVGYLAEKERNLHAEAFAIARIHGRARHERTFTGALQAAFDEVMRLFGAPRAMLALSTGDTGRHCWTFDRDAAGNVTAEVRGVTDQDDEAYFFSVSPGVRAWLIHAPTASDKLRNAVAIDEEGNRVRPGVEMPARFWQLAGADRALCAVTALREEWEARVYLLNPSEPRAALVTVHLLDRITQQLAPALQSLYLLRMQVGAAERARLARELHDRVVQSLIGMEMQLAAIERHEPKGDVLKERLRRLRQILQEETASIRDLMQGLRPVELRGEELTTFLADLVDRFQRQTGIHASFASNVPVVRLTPRQCANVARIVQEALVNVRKHSGAREVGVRLTQSDGGLSISIQDDGRGFDFSGRFTDAELWSQHRGPLVIKERARAIGATLSLDSRPGHGARLDIVVPHAA